jgi:HEAT repeat protein
LLAEILGLLGMLRPEEILITLLGDEDSGVRDAAIESLFSLTGEDLGYEPDAPENARAEAIGRWMDWLFGRG